MAARCKTAMVCGTVAALCAVFSVGAYALAEKAQQSKERPRGAVENCATQSGGPFPGAFTRARNLVVGPLSLIGAGGTPNVAWTSTGRKEAWQKFPLLVRNGHRVTVELSTTTRRAAGLAYGPLPQGETHLRDTYPVVTFIACGRGARSR